MEQPPIRPVPVVCDRCRAEGLAGDDVFAEFGALLDFEPVPRRMKRSDGWTEEVQRAFIAALSLAGTVRAACRAVGMSAFGVKQLLEAPASEGFAAAMEEAQAIAADERSRRLAEGVRTVASEQAGWRPPAAPWAKAQGRSGRYPPPPPRVPTPEEEEKEKERVLDRFFVHYWQRLQMERTARLSGKIAEADFYVRQITFLEVGIDLVAGGGSAEFLSRFRTERGHHLVDAAETPMSRLLDDARRLHWREAEEPDRPPAPLPEHLHDHGRYKRGGDPPICGGPDVEERLRRRKAEHAAAARAQVEWEAQARRDYEERRARDAP